ncbi:DnaB helicase C-terminal domain-containing protein [Bacillus haynesii]|uniref:DnaB-like helicase C-terminal domain-containing protein n=1 Tax=Bacillus haynesii TaxID=1925021 RepID=UPI00227FB72F|nr:DnaB-like helicase C-terminal domain-containing protein [Bacillus haynesii]MCY8048434.1 DnaB helicase C-terminal domain-containing protein [Bacillus haynesii]MCY8668772.1 DnaB helicase C-terminal domain-containing protein [Bacillus haynesii]MCY9324090.1 DnaB helicase C-terminal domain-containing protein [Bacillus haynesii]
MLLESQLLSKVLDEKNFFVTKQFNINESDFGTQRPVYEFIKDYVREYGETPDYRTVVGKFEQFDYQPEVSDTFPYLCKSLKSAVTKRKSFELLQKEATKNFKTMGGTEFINWMANEVHQIQQVANSATSTGTNIAVNGLERKDWYKDNKEKRSYTFIPTPYQSLTRWLGGGFELGDYLLLMAFTNRGKTWIGTQFGQTAWRNGFGVMHYSPELSKKQTTYRWETLDGHYNNVDLRRGQLDNEDEYLEYLDTFNENNENPYIVKTMEDLPDGLTVDLIEADLQMNPNVQMVIIDGFNLMVHGKGNNLRNNMTMTSRRLRQIFGRYQVAGLVIHQTTGSSEKDKAGDEDDDGLRIVKPPKLTDYSESIALIQDPATILTFDQHDGVGKISIEKAREPNVGKVLDLNCNFNYGYIREATAVDQF